MKKIKRLTAVALAICLLLCCAPFARADAPAFSDPASAAAFVRGQMMHRNTAFGFTYLAPAEEIGTLNGANLKTYFNAVWDGIEEAVFTHTGEGNEGDYLLQHTDSYGYSYSVSYSPSDTAIGYNVSVSADYYTTAAQEDRVTEAVSTALAGLAPAGKSDAEKIRAIADFICWTTAYDYAHLNDDGYPLQYSAYAALIDGAAVCQGYANLFYRLALEAGLDARIVTGHAFNGKETGPHAWNIVKAGDLYYDIDVTWMDGTGTDRYFLQGTEGFGDHFPADEYLSEPFASAYPISKTSYAENHPAAAACAAGHTWDGGKTTKTASCTTDGELTYTCTVCGDTRTEPVKAAGHTPIEIAAVPASCTKDGATAGSRCAVCGAILTAPEPVKAPGHQWDGGKTTKTASCTADGELTYTCTVCGGTRTEPVKAAGHTPEEIAAVPASCTKDGATAGSRCVVCGAILTAPEPVKAPGHQWDGGKTIKTVSCTTDGERTYTCTVCGGTRTEPVKAAGHTPEEIAAVPASCTKDGATAGRRCAVCGAILTAPEPVKAPGHQWDGGEITTEATTEREGEITYTCAVCGERKTEPIPKLPEAQFLPGDVDNDGEITAADARLALRGAVGLEDYPAGSREFRAADVSGDGVLSAEDARLILRAAVGLEQLA